MSPTVDALLEALALKRVLRAGWVRVGVADPESVADHSWGLGLLVLTLLPEGLDRGRALTYAALHDLPEVRVGDLTPHDGVDAVTKHAREAQAMEGLAARLGPQLGALWRQYEAQQDPEARFVRELDRLDMALQALAYARAGQGGLEGFVDSAAKVVREPGLVAILEEIRRVWPRSGP